MTILALSVKGKEYLYKPETARKVSKRSAQMICDIVNQFHFGISFDDRGKLVWHIHDVDSYDNAFYYAQTRSFTIRNGIVTAHVR